MIESELALLPSVYCLWRSLFTSNVHRLHSSGLGFASFFCSILQWPTFCVGWTAISISMWLKLQREITFTHTHTRGSSVDRYKFSKELKRSSLTILHECKSNVMTNDSKTHFVDFPGVTRKCEWKSKNTYLHFMSTWSISPIQLNTFPFERK